MVAISPDESCHACPAGKYGAGGALTACQACPSLTTSPSGSSDVTHCTCQSGYRSVGSSCKHVTTAARCPSGYKETGKYYYQEKHCYDENEGGHKCGGGCTVKAHWASGSPQTCKYWKRGYTKTGCVFGICCCRYADCDGSGHHRTGNTCVPNAITNRECIQV